MRLFLSSIQHHAALWERSVRSAKIRPHFKFIAEMISRRPLHWLFKRYLLSHHCLLYLKDSTLLETGSKQEKVFTAEPGHLSMTEQEKRTAIYPPKPCKLKVFLATGPSTLIPYIVTSSDHLTSIPYSFYPLSRQQLPVSQTGNCNDRSIGFEFLPF